MTVEQLVKILNQYAPHTEVKIQHCEAGCEEEPAWVEPQLGVNFDAAGTLEVRITG